MMSEFFDLQVIGATGGTFLTLGIYLVKLQKKLGLNKLDADPETIQKRFGAFGESIFVGLILGFRYWCVDYKPGDIINLGMSMAASNGISARMVKS